jgi:hypothetical protein
MLQNSGGERLTIFVCGFIKIKERFGSQGLGSVYFKVKFFRRKIFQANHFSRNLFLLETFFSVWRSRKITNIFIFSFNYINL